MKKTIVLVMLLAMLSVTGCTRPRPAAEMPQTGGSVQIPNPWRGVTEAEEKTALPADETEEIKP